MAPPPPLLADLGKALADRDGHPDRTPGVILLRRGVIEEDHDPVTREMLERALVLDNQRADHRVVPAQEPEDLLGFGRLRERGEVAQITEHRGDLAAVARQECLALRARHELRDLRREEPGKLPALAVDGLEQPRIGDANRSLLGESGRERLLGVGERPDIGTREGKDAAHRAVLLDRHAEDRPVATDLLTGRDVLPVVLDVLDLDWLAKQRNPSDDAVPPRLDGVLALPPVELVGPAGGRRHAIGVAFEDVRDAVVGMTQPDRRPNRRVQHDLEVERRAAHDREDLVGRGLTVDRLALRIVQPLAGQ